MTPPDRIARRPAHARAGRLLLSSILAASLAACGGDDGPSVPAAAAPPAAPPAAAPAPPQAVLGAAEQAPPDPAWLASSAQVAVLPKAAIDAANGERGWADLAGPARCDVVLHRIQHPTTGPKGEATDASGAVYVPGGAGCPGPFPLLAYQRGTDLDRARTMADPQDRESQAVAGFFAARGYLVVATDYLGYAGSSFPYHPYLHAASEARTTIDAIRAARVLAQRLGVPVGGRLFLAGYSQGAHATLAAQREIERPGATGGPGLALAASGGMSGPYDLGGTFTEGASILPLLTIDLGSTLVAQAAELRLGDLVQARAETLLRDRSSLREALQANSVLGFRPAAPLLLCAGARDPVVPFSNTARAADDFRARGAPALTVVDVDAEPAFAARLPPPRTPIVELGSYHQGTVPPLCFAAVRDRLFEPLR